MTVLAIHGAFRGGWSFGPLRSELMRRGTDLRAPSLTGMGEHAPPPHERPLVRLAHWCSDVRRYAELEDLREIVLLGHSQGGLVVRAVAGELADRLRAVAYLDAPIPAIGQRGVDLMGSPASGDLPAGTTWLEPTPVQPDAHLDAATAAWINARLCATPLGPSLDPVTSDAPQVPVHIAFCEHTPAAYPSSFTRSRLDANGQHYETIDAPHDAPITNPTAVADWVVTMTGATPKASSS